VTAVAETIARRVASHLRDGEVVNLGIGIPTLVADFIEDRPIVLHTENGMIGVGPTPEIDAVDVNLVNAGKLPVSESPGAAYFSSSQSFGMIRGGHLSVAVLGALQVDARGCVANWAVPGRPILGVGGAMDLLVGARRVIVATTHVTKAGEPKLVQDCTLPLTATRPVDLIVTDHATFAVRDGGLVLVEVAGASSRAWVGEHTAASYREALA
jgi:3-oxoacid CoA-transferase B subunit